MKYPCGTRVRLKGHSHTLTIAADIGTIVGPAEYGYYLVRLDEPATYDDGIGRPERITEIRQAWDNLEPLGSSSEAPVPDSTH